VREKRSREEVFAENLKRIRKARNLTMPQVWEPAGIGKSTYSTYEAGTAIPSAAKAVEIAKVLGVTVDELLLDQKELAVSEDMRPILRRLEILPEDLRGQARIAIKGVLFGYEQEALR